MFIRYIRYHSVYSIKYYAILIASTGQSSAACLAQPTDPAGISLTFTTATVEFSSIWKTSGQVSAQRPQPVHKSLSTVTFNPFSPFLTSQAV